MRWLANQLAAGTGIQIWALTSQCSLTHAASGGPAQQYFLNAEQDSLCEEILEEELKSSTDLLVAHSQNCIRPCPRCCTSGPYGEHHIVKCCVKLFAFKVDENRKEMLVRLFKKWTFVFKP